MCCYAAAVAIFNTNKQAAATMCSAAEAMKLLLGGALGVELVTALLEAKTGWGPVQVECS